MDLTDLDSNHFDAVIRFKKTLITDDIENYDYEKSPSVCRKVKIDDEYVVKNLLQRQKRLTPEEISSIVEEYRAGKSTYELAEQFECHRSTISGNLKKQGVEVTRCKAVKLDVGRVISMYEAGRKSAEIAEVFGVGPNVVLQCLRDNDIEIRSRWDY